MNPNNFLEKDFYKKVEVKGSLKKVLYSDSVAKYTETLIKRKNEECCNTITFDNLWNELISVGNQITYQDGKEYIFIKTDHIKCMSYDVIKDYIIIGVPEYIMRHKIKTKLCQLKISDDITLDITKNHSLLKYNPRNRSFDIIKPKDCKYLPVIYDMYMWDMYMWGNIKFDYFANTDMNDGISKNPHLAYLRNVKALRTNIVGEIEYDDYVYDICNPTNQTFIANGCVVHNTDSIFINIPTAGDPSKLTPDQLWKKAEQASNGINDLIIDYTKDVLLPRCNIKPERNQTYFKTELLMESIMCLEVKKKYAYKLLIKEGNPLNPPKISYTGIDVIRSNVAKLTQELLKDIIENIALNLDVLYEDRKQLLTKTIDHYYNKYSIAIQELDIDYIGIPGKWARVKNIISGMKLYNYIMNETIFEPTSAAKFIYINPVSIGEFKNVNGVCVPYDFNKKIVQEKFNIFGIKINTKLHWNTLYNTTCQRVIDVIKK